MVGTHPGGKPEAKLQLRKPVLDFRSFWCSHLPKSIQSIVLA